MSPSYRAMRLSPPAPSNEEPRYGRPVDAIENHHLVDAVAAEITHEHLIVGWNCQDPGTRSTPLKGCVNLPVVLKHLNRGSMVQ